MLSYPKTSHTPTVDAIKKQQVDHCPIVVLFWSYSGPIAP
jgi:hypothetical protein